MPLDALTFSHLRQQVRRFVTARLVPNEDRVEREDAVPEELISEMKALGLFGLSIPEEYGGLGLTLSEEAALCLELGQTSPAFRSVFGTNVGIGSQGILIDGTEAQKRVWLPRIATGEAIFSFALTEPDAGSDAASLRTSAVLSGDEYVLNGVKRYITNAPRATGFTVMARTDPSSTRADGISAFIVPSDTPGLRLGSPDRKMGQRGTMTCDVIFEDARVPAGNLIGGTPGGGFKTAMRVLDRGRLHIAAVAAGMARRLLNDSLAYASARRQFGKPIGDFQAIQLQIGNMATQLQAARLMAYWAADAVSRGRADAETGMAKIFCSEVALAASIDSMKVHGGYGYSKEYEIERLYRDSILMSIGEGTNDVIRTVIAKSVTKGELVVR